MGAGAVKFQPYFVGRVDLYELRGHEGRWFCQESPLTYVDRDGKRYTAQAGTLTDFASVPRILWSLLPSYGKHTRASIVHDAMCAERKYPSRHVHDLLLRMLETCGVSKIVRLSMHRAVRWFGPRFRGA